MTATQADARSLLGGAQGAEAIEADRIYRKWVGPDGGVRTEKLEELANQVPQLIAAIKAINVRLSKLEAEWKSFTEPGAAGRSSGKKTTQATLETSS